MEDVGTLLTPHARELVKALIQLHCIADSACAGFGLAVSPPPERALAHCLANLLLTARGSLSRVAKHHGIVLPKLRTPQSGLTLRSLSHHLTLHASEVEVMWRSMPWPNVEENTINIMVVPWPHRLNRKCFAASPETFESTRYFQYQPDVADEDISIAQIVKLACHTEGDVGSLHMLVFPELALSRNGYGTPLRELFLARQTGALRRVPMIVTGV